MAKREPFKKGQKFCCFCGKPAQSREHFWPEWAASLLPDSTHHFKSAGVRRKQTEFQVRPGAPKTIKLKVVCKPCNNEWMSRLETDAQRWLEPMMRMEPVELTPKAQNVLARYFMMKVFVADQSLDGSVYFTQEERSAFYASRTIPGGAYIVIVRFISEPHPMARAFFKEATLRDSVTADVSFDPANFTFRFGALFLQVMSLRKIKAQIEQHPSVGLVIFPPHNETFRWPPSNSISPAEAQTMQLLFTQRPSG